ncbi:inositol-pentakisphosphate 2-kinase [Coprinopsis marcescibilis]|uniref:Inositol-pentakisphosphate 2-kinase n=1 Tax=Coprinopsis marcescibilis TaxID=230819 RepID=A0A5C3LB86_COPMA|nr:inositol-pentakisphosphate 2-kinase [Coprinopsis marcescibilis]
MPSIGQTTPGDWRYVSEGGATIVFSYRGPDNPNFNGTVLRLRKALVPVFRKRSNTIEDASARPDTLDEEEPDDPTIEYQTKCMSRLIPLEHLPRLETVDLDRDWLERLVASQNLNRPEVRRGKDGIDVNRKKGVLATDLVGGNWLAVEIKPKWAFLPGTTHLSESTKPVKTQTCRFCMHNHLRTTKGTIVPMAYCPLDLFSEDEERMKTAVNALWDSWTESEGTVNNLKVFAHGKMLHPADAKLMVSPDFTAEAGIQAIRDAFTSSIVLTLKATPVLSILSKLQRTLDTLDIEGLSKLWRHTELSAPLYRTTFAEFFNSRETDDRTGPPSTPLGVSSLFLSSPEPSIPDWVGFLDSYLSPFSSQLDHANPTPKDLRYYLLAYLLSATFKDCSVIVRLDFLRPNSEPKIEIKPNTVTVIDLDPKSMDKLRGWEKLDKEIATIYAKNTQKRTCVDANSINPT